MTITITDDGGRQVTIPAQVDKVFCTSPLGTYLVYTLAPEKLAGWNITPTELEQEYIPEEYRPTVGLGGWFGKNTTGNVEEIIKRGPDLVLSIGDMDEADDLRRRPHPGTAQHPGGAGRLHSGRRPATPTASSASCWANEERAEELAEYSDEVIAKAQENSAPRSPRTTG